VVAPKERLALDALATEWASSPPAGQRHTGSLRGDLLTRFRPWLRQLNRKSFARVVAGLVAEAQTNPEFAELYRKHFVQPRRDATRELLVRARHRGEIAANTNLEVTLDLLYGPSTTACCTATPRSPSDSLRKSSATSSPQYLRKDAPDRNEPAQPGRLRLGLQAGNSRAGSFAPVAAP